MMMLGTQMAWVLWEWGHSLCPVELSSVHEVLMNGMGEEMSMIPAGREDHDAMQGKHFEESTMKIT